MSAYFQKLRLNNFCQSICQVSNIKKILGSKTKLLDLEAFSDQISACEFLHVKSIFAGSSKKFETYFRKSMGHS